MWKNFRCQKIKSRPRQMLLLHDFFLVKTMKILAIFKYNV